MAKEKPESESKVPEKTTSSESTNGTTGMKSEAAMSDSAVMNPEMLIVDAAAMNPEATNPPIAEVQAQQINVMTAPVTMINTGTQNVSTPPLPQGTAADGKYEEFLLMPDAAWPPPIFIRKSVSAQERFYIENRWHSQWNYYDKQAGKAKNRYILFQGTVVIGSVIVPIILGASSFFGDILEALLPIGAGSGRNFVDLITIGLSAAVAISAGVAGFLKYGDNWSSYRSAAEELLAEKFFYDMLAGPYANNLNPFATFVERTEGIVANQNGKYFQAVQQQIQKQATENDELLDKYKASIEEDEAGG